MKKWINDLRLLWRLEMALTWILWALSVGICLAVFVALFAACDVPDDPESVEDALVAETKVKAFRAVTIPEVVTSSGAVFVGTYRVTDSPPVEEVGQAAYFHSPPVYVNAVFVRGYDGWAWVQKGPPWVEWPGTFDPGSGARRLAPILCEQPKTLAEAP